MDIHRLPVLSDNYVFVLHDPVQNRAAVVDPAVAKPVLACLQDLGAPLVAIFNTHPTTRIMWGAIANCCVNSQKRWCMVGSMIAGGFQVNRCFW